MVFDLLKWWYGWGWRDSWRRVGESVRKTQMSFSLVMLLRNLFAPWKQIVTLPGKSVDERFRASIDNLISRTIGFFVRLGTLLVAAAIIALSATAWLVGALVWPLLPPALVYCLIRLVIG